MNEKHKLKPWAAGPFELIRHAEGHLAAGSDFDKRMALVSFDNAIEVSVTTFLQLHPKQRCGKSFDRKETERWLSNFHTKLEFLEAFVAGNSLAIEVSIDEIIWYHQLRNELYHSGNGMTPEAHCLIGARKAAIWVFSILFGVDAMELLQPPASIPSPPKETPASKPPSKSSFWESFVRLEREIFWTLHAAGALKDPKRYLSFKESWSALTTFRNDVPGKFEGIVTRATQVRNRMAHGNPVDMADDDLDNLAHEIEKVAAFIESRAPSKEYRARNTVSLTRP